MNTRTWTEECKEWQSISEEMVASGTPPSAFDVTQEQRRRMSERGERPLTYEEILGRLQGGMNFGQAIEALKSGEAVCRAGWNGKGMFLVIVGNWDGDVATTIKRPSEKTEDWIFDAGRDTTHASFIAMKTAQNTFIPWLASQADMLAEDWELVE